MKYALIIPDGVADEPQSQLGNRTPLQAASIPAMDEVVRSGVLARTNNVPEQLPSGSDVGTMSLFGYDPLRWHTGRAPIEAAARGIELADGDWAIRCNLVTIKDGRMVSFTAGQYPNNAAAALMRRLQEDQCGGRSYKFFPGVSYRNLLVYRSRGEPAPFDRQTTSTPPHDITGQDITPFLPDGPGGSELRDLMQRSAELFQEMPENRMRSEQGLAEATQIWLWGQGSRPGFMPFEDLYGVRGAVITAVDLLRGMGRLIGWEVVEVEGATGYLDTDYAAKGRAAIETLAREEVDFCVVHVEATDEASHEGDTAAKIAAVEAIDEHIVAPVHDWLKSQGEYRLLVCPDHPTFLRTRTHSHGDCPAAACGTNIAPDDFQDYDEITASASELRFAVGARLMPWFLGLTAETDASP